MKSRPPTLILRFCSPEVLVVSSIIPEGFDFFIFTNFISAFFTHNFGKVNIILQPGGIYHLDPGQVFTYSMISKIGMTQGTKHVKVLTYIQSKGMMDYNVIFPKSGTEQDYSPFTGSFAGRQDHLRMRHQMATAIWTEKIDCFHNSGIET
jgi:hypothetical protein